MTSEVTAYDRGFLAGIEVSEDGGRSLRLALARAEAAERLRDALGAQARRLRKLCWVLAVLDAVLMLGWAWLAGGLWK
jgi:hypothetical protein